MIGRDLDGLDVAYNSEDIITRLYVEGEYSDFGYIGIDDVNPTGLTYLLNFDYYKKVGLFTDVHQEAYDAYINAITAVNSTIKEKYRQLVGEKDV